MSESSTDVFVVMPNWIGDVVMATPAIRALRKRFAPPYRLVGVMRPYTSSVLEGTPWFDEIVHFDRAANDRVLGFWPLLRMLRERRPDTVVIFPSSLGFSVVSWMAGIKNRIGYAKNLRGWTLTKGLNPKGPHTTGSKRSVVGHYLELAYAAGCTPESPFPELAIMPADEAGADVVWQNLGLRKFQTVIALNPGSKNGNARTWPAERFVELSRRVVASVPNSCVLVMCGPQERDIAASIAAEVNDPRVHSMADQDMRLGITSACIRRTSLLLTADSGLRHLAAAFQVPVVCLSGPIDPEWTFSFNPREVHLRLDLACSPCGKLDCPLLHRKCMTDLTVEYVERAVKQQLAAVEKRAA